MFSRRTIIILFLVTVALQAGWAAPSYTGSISNSSGGINGIAGCSWMNDNPRISWVVTWTGTSWNYAYNFSVDEPGAVGFLIIETSPGFTVADMRNFQGFSQATVGLYTSDSQGSNWNMPVGGINGIKFENFLPSNDSQYISVSFDSNRAPVWGDFYCKDGKASTEAKPIKNAVWNAGFLVADPTDAAADGSINYHILRPDTQTTPPTTPPTIPEATAMVLGPSGLAMLVALERHRRRYQRIRDGVSLGYYMIKRAVDMVLAFIALVLFAPLFVPIMLLIRLDSPGPIFFRRLAIGKSGKIFGMLKFRTMIVNAEQALHTDDNLKDQYYANGCKLKDDPRVTRIGKFLRKTSLDELPQFLNVMAGDMTFVGPRPIAEDEIEMYGPAVEQFKTVTPGITGLWQTQGRSDTSYETRVQLDMLYIKQRSLILDIRVVLCTLPAVLLRRGAH